MGSIIAVRTGAGQSFAVGSSHGGTTSSGGILAGGLLRVYVTLSTAQLTLLNNSFNSLKDSVYGGLITQTRLAPYFDAIGLVVTADGIALVKQRGKMSKESGKTAWKTVHSDICVMIRYFAGETLDVIDTATIKGI